MSASEHTDVLRTGEAGGKVIRGGVLRGAGYAAGILLGAGTSVLLLRHLGVADFGRYGVVIALLGIVGGITDAGLTAVGSRELAIRPAAERPALMRNLVALRILLTSAGVVVATLFALAAGYDGVVVAGTAVAGVGILLLHTQSTLMMPLAIELRYGSITLVETLRHALTLVGIAALVVAGASLFAFFTIPVAVGVATVALTPFLVAGMRGMSPSVDRATAFALLRESLPLAAAIAMNVVYLRLLVLLVSLGTDDTETGLFATSFRVFEILLGIPTLVLGVALPLLAVAGAEDRERLRYAVQRLTETALAVSLLLVLVTVVLARPAIRLLGDGEYDDAAPMLQLQAFALIGIFLSQVWTLALVSLRRQRDVALANGIALVVVVALGLGLVNAYEGIGGAATAVASETLLAVLVYVFLFRADRDAAPRLRFAPRPLAAAGAGALVALVLPLSAWIAAPLAALVFVGVAIVTGAVPPEVLPALRARSRR
ncbi:MAG: oligosaccharide flippase family protein [Actinomycetota bacterium]|nr:oligosaccharide flippase family protein [Actinomycetota bacterium]